MRGLHANTPLPIDPSFENENQYLESLLTFATSCELFQRLCGGVHILDFLTKEPDLYSTVLQQDWRDWFHSHEIPDILDLLMREDISVIEGLRSTELLQSKNEAVWRNGPSPPVSLLDYILTIRKHALVRGFIKGDGIGSNSISHKGLQRHVAVGMKPKKIHEVENFVKYVDDLSEHIASSSPYNITHIVDFGSGQNYLGRALASPPYNKRVVALESKQLNIDGARNMDVIAKLAEREKIMRNKKQYRSGLSSNAISVEHTPDSKSFAIGAPVGSQSQNSQTHQPSTDSQQDRITYVETLIRHGDLSKVLDQVPNSSSNLQVLAPQLMVISLHSCGNLLHHGVRSLILNPSVKAVAMVGCCYNLVTERLGPPTYKLPSLRSANHRVNATSSACDPHGFPMSERLAAYKHRHGEGIRFNITARMMAVQAPQNWTIAESESFFTRHFYRALLQKIFLDHGLVTKPRETNEQEEDASPRGLAGKGPPITIGSLRKACYTSFRAYVRGALAKLSENIDFSKKIEKQMQGLTDNEIEKYEVRYADNKKTLSVVWSLMAFSASVVESMMVVDRWLFLREQDEVKECWVESVFEYAQSPRNLVIVGIKR